MLRIAARLACIVGAALVPASHASAQPTDNYDYLLLATSRTSTMEREMNEAAASGYRFQDVMGGNTEFADAELVAVMVRDESPRSLSYRVLATTLSSTMQEELDEAGAEGYDHRGQTMYSSLFGGPEIVVILERDESASDARFDYELLATNKTSTMQREMKAAGERGFEVVGLTLGETEFGGFELVVITRRVGHR